jgi:hypothetical protein
MKQLIAIVVLVVAANAFAATSYWWDRTQVRSEFELSEEQCVLSDITRNRSIAMLRCTIRHTSETPWPKRRELERLGYAAIAVNLGSGWIEDFAPDPAFLDHKSHFIVPATQGNGMTTTALPPMPVRDPTPLTEAPPHLRKFRAKIRIGRLYQPSLVRLESNP